MATLTQDTGGNEENEKEREEENITNRKTADDTKTKAHASKKRRTSQAFDAELAQKQLNDSFKTLNQVLQNKQGNSEDDCDLYGKLLATKLKRYPVQQRQRVMYKIDGLLLDNPPETCSSTPFPSSSAPRPPSAYTSQDSPVYSHHSQASVYSQHYQPSPAYSNDSQTSGYSQHSRPPSVGSHHYQKTIAFAPSSQLSPLHIQVLQAPLQENPRTTPYSTHPSPAQNSQPSPLHLEPIVAPLEEGVLPLSTTRSIIQSAFVDALTDNS